MSIMAGETQLFTLTKGGYYMVATLKNDLIRNVKPVGQNSKPKDSKLMKESRSKNNLMQNVKEIK